MTKDPKTCEHLNFDAQVDVGRITEEEGGPVVYHMASLRIRCADCCVPMQFQGLPMGYNAEGAAVDPFGTEARLAIHPMGTLPNTPRIKGYTITNRSPRQ